MPLGVTLALCAGETSPPSVAGLHGTRRLPRESGSASPGSRERSLRPSPRTALVALAGVLLLGAALRAVPPPHWHESDPENYAAIAWKLAQGNPEAHRYTGPPHKPSEAIGPRAFAIRPGLTVPVSWLMRVFQPTEWAVAAYPLLLGLSEILLAYLLGSLLWNRWAGVLAALAVATLPLAVLNARVLQPDLPAAVLMGWAMYAGLRAMAARRRQGAIELGLAAGLVLGLSWLTKETVVLVLPALAGLLAVHWRESRRRVLLVAGAGLCGLLAVVAAESVAYQRGRGDWLFRFRELERNFEQCKENFFYRESPAYGWTDATYGRVLATRLGWSGPRTLLFGRRSLALGFLACCAAVLLWRRGTPRLAIPLVWFVLLLLAFNFGSTSWSSYRPLVPFPHYFYPMVLPAALLLAAGMQVAMERLRAPAVGWKRLLSAGALALPVLFVFSAGVSYRWTTLVRRTPLAIAALAKELPSEAVVATDFRTRFTLSYHRTGLPEFSRFTVSLEDPADVAGADYLLVRPQWLAWLRDRYGFEIPAAASPSPDDWIQVFDRAGLHLFQRKAPRSMAGDVRQTLTRRRNCDEPESR